MTLATEHTCLALLAALDVDLIESQLGILTDALAESGREDLSAWCRQQFIKKTRFPNTELDSWSVSGWHSTYSRTESAARAELLRRVVAHLAVECQGCNREARKCEDCGAVTRFLNPNRGRQCGKCGSDYVSKVRDCRHCHGHGSTGLRPQPVPCTRCGGRGYTGEASLADAFSIELRNRECPECHGTGTTEGER